MTVYREYPCVPMAVLPQFGPAWETAYLNPGDAPVHARTDITQWVSVDAE